MPAPLLLRASIQSDAGPGQGIGDVLIIIVACTHPAMWCVLRCNRSPARIEFGAVYVFLKIVVRTYVYFVTFDRVIANEVTPTWLPFTTKINIYLAPISGT